MWTLSGRKKSVEDEMFAVIRHHANGDLWQDPPGLSTRCTFFFPGRSKILWDDPQTWLLLMLRSICWVSPAAATDYRFACSQWPTLDCFEKTAMLNVRLNKQKQEGREHNSAMLHASHTTVAPRRWQRRCGFFLQKCKQYNWLKKNRLSLETIWQPCND